MKNFGEKTAFHFKAALFEPYRMLLSPPPVSKSLNSGAVSRCGPMSPAEGSPNKVASSWCLSLSWKVNFAA